MSRTSKWLLLALAAIAAAAVCGGLNARAATTDAGQSSVNVALIPGKHAPHYADTGADIPPFPASDPQVSGYHYSELPVASVTTQALQGVDTVVLYGLKWSDIPADGQAAINAFAKTGKVIIWDADSTGHQDYTGFAAPFSTTASGVKSTNHGAVVSYAPSSPLASSDSGAATYLDPAAMVASTHLIGHMNVMDAGASGWAPALIAANSHIPNGGWVVAWAYGSTQDHTGMLIYSGMDADAFTDTPVAVKELALELAAPFSRTPDSGCSPGCTPPPVPTTGGTDSGNGGSSGSSGTAGSASSGLGSPQTPTFAQCSLSHRAPLSWVRGTVSLSLKTSVTAGIHGKVLTAAGKVVGTGVEAKPGHLTLVVNTRLLPSNKKSRLTAAVYVNSAKACSLQTGLSVDNRPPTIKVVRTHLTKGATRITVVADENVLARLSASGKRLVSVHLRAAHATVIVVPHRYSKVSVTLVDRAGNRSARTLQLR
jgi:hypothetical protein